MRMHIKSEWIASLIALSLSACGSSRSTVAPTDTDTDTATATGAATSTDTGSTTATQTSVTTTVTTTSTATGTTTSGPFCNGYSDPRETALGGVLSLSSVTWQFVDENGKQKLINTETDPYGYLTGCGTLLAETTSYTPPSLTHWKGLSTKHCIYLAPDNTTDPIIYGTGIAQNPTDASSTIITGANIKIWSVPFQIIAACPN
jgi:hypothetical protein